MGLTLRREALALLGFFLFKKVSTGKCSTFRSPRHQSQDPTTSSHFPLRFPKVGEHLSLALLHGYKYTAYTFLRYQKKTPQNGRRLKRTLTVSATRRWLTALNFSVYPRKCKAPQCAKASFILVSFCPCLIYPLHVTLSVKIRWQ